MKKILLIFLTLFSFGTALCQNLTVNIQDNVPVCNPGECIELTADFPIVRATNDYTVSSIPLDLIHGTDYDPANPTAGILGNTDDDKWTTNIYLPFPFCFYGQTYNSVLIGSNGVVHFPNGSQPSGGFCEWNFSGIPSISPTGPNSSFPIKNAVYGVYQDTDIRMPPVTNFFNQNVNYYIDGTAPNRVFIVNFNELPLYSSNCSSSGLQSSQIIFYEGTNVIDVNIIRRNIGASCDWNTPDGAGVVGLMNPSGSKAVIPTGRNIGRWSTTNEAWRFTPAQAGPTVTTLTWLENDVDIPGSTNQNPLLNVCPTGSTKYTAKVKYLQCDGTEVEITDDVTITPEPVLPTRNPENIMLCSAAPGPYTFNINQNSYMLNSPTYTSADFEFRYYTDAALTMQIPNGSLGAYTPASSVYPQTIWVAVDDIRSTSVVNCSNTRSFTINAGTSPSGTFSYSNLYCDSITTPQYPVLNGLTSGGNFTVAPPTGLIFDFATGAITPNGSTLGTYTISYDIPASGTCPAYSAPPVTVTIDTTPVKPDINTTPSTCSTVGSSTITNYNAALTYIFTPPGPTVSGGVISGMTAGTSYSVNASNGSCTSLDSDPFSNDAILNSPDVPIINSIAPTCSADGSSTITNYSPGLIYIFNPLGPTVTGGVISNMVIGQIYTVTAGDGVCTSGDSASFSNAAMLTSPVLVITNPAAVCSPTTVDLTAAAVTAGSTGGGTLSYWTDAAGTVALANPNAVSVSGTYYIKSTLGTCSDIEPVSVTINPTPVLVITNPGAACTPATVDLTAAAVTAGSTGGGTLSYWTDAAATSPLANPNAVSVSGTYYIQSTVGSCSDIEAVTVTVGTSPVLVITNPAAVCSPTTVDLTAAAVTAGSTGGGTLSYWTDAAGTVALANPNAVSVSGTYYIKSTLGTCSDIEPVSVTINPTPVLVITNPGAACTPATVDLTAAAVTAGSTGGGTLSYWTDAAATSPLANPNAVSVSGTYYIQSTVGSCSDIEAVTVTVGTSPVLVITNPAAVCSPTTVDLTAAAVTAGSTGGGTLSYWTDAAGTVALANPNAVSVSGTYYIKSTLGTCSDIEPVSVTINPTPVLVITNPGAACTPATVDLTAAAVTAGSTGGGTLSYWTDAAATSPLANPNAVSVSGTYYIQSTVGSCSDIEAVTVTVGTSPVLVITNPAAVCSPTTVDLTAAAVTAGSTGGGTLSYWTDAAGTVALANPNAVSVSGTYYIKSTLGTCSDIEPVSVTINPTPVLVITNPGAACTPATVDLTAAAVTAGSTGGGTLSYWTDAAATSPLANPNAVSVSGTYYIQSTVGSCSDIEAVTVTVGTSPVLVITNPAAVCSPTTVDLTAAAVTAGSTGGGTLSYWTDAAGTVALANPNAVSVSGTYYIKSTLGTCSDIEPVSVTINPTPVLVITNPGAACTPATVDLTAAAVTAGSTGGGTLSYWTDAAATSPLANPNAVSVSGTYYIQSTVGSCSDIEAVTVTVGTSPVLVITNPAAVCSPTTVDLTAAAVTAGSTGGGTLSYWTDAAGTVALANPNAVSVSGTYYIKSTLGTCSDIEPVSVTINPTPVLVITNPEAACTPATVDLTAAAVTAGSTGGGTLSYWTDAAATSPLANPNAVSVSGTYYIQSTVGSCSDIEAVTVTVGTSPVLVITNPAAVCSPTTVDLTAAAVTAGSTGGGTLSYWTDAAGTVALANPNAVSVSGTYYIKSTLGTCSDIEPVTAIIHSIPVITLTGGYVCVDAATGTPLSTYTLESGLSSAQYTFVWTDSQGNTVGNGSSYTAIAPGTYSVVATTVAVPYCSSVSASAIVQPSSSPTDLTFVTSNYFADVLSIEVTAIPAGNYEYQLDGGQYQSSNVFTHVSPGTHIVSVRDIHDVCSPYSESVEVIDFPRYFTPNGDGIHDTWNIPFLNAQLQSKIEIFDRLGKLLKVIRPSGSGWDGTYNGHELPSTDYWFVVYYEENSLQKVFRSHFAMKR